MHDGTFQASATGQTSSCMNIPVKIVFLLIFILKKVFRMLRCLPAEVHLE